MPETFRHLQRIENKLNQDVETILLLLRSGGSSSGVVINGDDDRQLEPTTIGSSSVLPSSSSALSPTTSFHRTAPVRYLPHQPFSIPAVVTHSLGSSEQNLRTSPPSSLPLGNGIFETSVIVSPSSSALPSQASAAYIDETAQVCVLLIANLEAMVIFKPFHTKMLCFI